MMKKINDKDGVDIIISPVQDKDGFQVNVDYNFSNEYFHDLDNLSKDWDLKLMDGRRHVGNAKFSAYQFMADGVVRRTITLKSMSLEPRWRGQKKSYDLAKFVLDTVERECDALWGPAYGEPVLFIEKRNMSHLPEKERNGLFDFLKKIGEKILGYEPKDQPNAGDLSVSVIGDAISMQLIEGHLMRSNSTEAEDRDPRHNRP